MSGNGHEKTSLIISTVVTTVQLVCANAQPMITVCAMVLTVRMEIGQWFWVEGCIGRFGAGWCKVRLVVQCVSHLCKVRLLQKQLQLCTNVHRCAQMFVVACKVFPLHHPPPPKAQCPDVQGSVAAGIVVRIRSVQR